MGRIIMERYKGAGSRRHDSVERKGEWYDSLPNFRVNINTNHNPTIVVQGQPGEKFYVDWGDGSNETHTFIGNDTTITHTYATSTNVDIAFYGDFTKFLTSTSNDWTLDLSVFGGFSNIQGIRFTGMNYITGDISVLANKSDLSLFQIYGRNTISGDLSSISGLSLLSTFDVEGNNTITGNINSLSGLTNLLNFRIFGSNTIYGDLSSISGLTGLKYFYIQGNNAISGSLSSISGLTSIIYFIVYHNPSSTLITGDISVLASLTTLQRFILYSPIADYTSSTWLTTGLTMFNLGGDASLTTAEVDQLIIDLDADISYGKTLIIKGNCQPRSSASDTAVSNIVGRGGVVQTN